VRIIEEIARGTGTLDGMIGGQVVDLEAEQNNADGRDAGVYSSRENGCADYGESGEWWNLRGS